MLSSIICETTKHNTNTNALVKLTSMEVRKRKKKKNEKLERKKRRRKKKSTKRSTKKLKRATSILQMMVVAINPQISTLNANTPFLIFLLGLLLLLVHLLLVFFLSFFFDFNHFLRQRLARNPIRKEKEKSIELANYGAALVSAQQSVTMTVPCARTYTIAFQKRIRSFRLFFTQIKFKMI